MTFALDLQGLSVFAAAAANSGSDLNGALESLDIRISSEGVLFSQWPLGTVAGLLQALENGARRQHFPFAFADVFRFDGHAAVAAFLASAGSLREIRPLINWVPDLIHPAIKMVYFDDGSLARLKVNVADTQGEHVDMPVFVELIMAVSVKLARLMAPEIIKFSQVDFAHAARHAVSSYEHYFGCPVSFQAACNQLVTASKHLDAQLPGRMPQANAQAVESIRLNLLGDGLAPTLTAMVEKLLQERVGLLQSGIAGTAKILKMHPRTLQRQLKFEGISYSELLAKVRHDKACAMLRASALDIESIGIKLGFSDRRSFTQSFGKWQGQTPSNYRRQTKA